MRTRYSEAQRRELLRAWKDSKKGVTEFCRSHRIVVSTFYGWLRRMSDSPQSGLRLVEAIPIIESAPAESAAWAWELVGPMGTLRGERLDDKSLKVLASAVLRRDGGT